MIVDLHTHSTASDGRFTPAALVEKAHEAGVSVLALTDHDSIDGLDEAAEAAAKLGIHFVRGVELEIDWPEIGTMETREFHLLGLGFGKASAKFRQILMHLQHKREKRNKLIVEKMLELGIDVTLEEIHKISGVPYIGRPHFAQYLVAKKVAKNNDDAFRKYLGRGKPLYVPKGGVALRRAISAIKESGGIAVLAHPTSLFIAWGRLPGVLARFRQSGLDGIEAYHPNVTERAAGRLCAMAQELGYYITAGSDFHGDRQRERKLGRGPGGAAIHDSQLELPAEIRCAWGLG